MSDRRDRTGDVEITSATLPKLPSGPGPGEPRPAPDKSWLKMESTRKGGYEPNPRVTVVYQPSVGHRCQIGWENRPLVDDHPARRHGVTEYVHFTHDRDPVGTVLACGECGRTWVAHRPRSNVFVNSWRPEGRFERWRRERRRR